MKTTGNAILFGLALMAGGTVLADHHGLQPVPEASGQSSHGYVHQAPVYHGAPSIPYDSEVVEEEYEVVELFGRVKYKDHDEMAPCAVSKIVQVNDPCSRGDCAGPRCVNVEICVPGGVCERVKVSKGGDRVRYDYGDYKVDVRVKDGYVEVDYQD